MAKRRRGNGSIRTFEGAWRHFREWLHPRDARGRFIDKPDFYVPPRQTNRNLRNRSVPHVQRWHETQPWVNLPDRSHFTRPNDRIGWTRDTVPMGYAWRDPEELSSPWRNYYVDPDLPPGMYAYINSDGNVMLADEWFDLTPEERRHALYFAAARANLSSIDNAEAEKLFGPGATWENVFGPTPGDLGDHAEGEIQGYYLRFGEWPEDERSQNFVEGHREDGVSVYGLGADGLPRDTDPYGDTDQDTAQMMHDRIARARRGEIPAYVVTGKLVGIGHDNEPLLNDVSAVAEWDPKEPLSWNNGVTGLNGYVRQDEVMAEAYATLADGDALWLDEHLPGLAEVVRREAVAVGLPIDGGEIAAPRDGDNRFLLGEEPFITEPPRFEDFDDYDEFREAELAWKSDVITMVSRGELPVEDAQAYFALPGQREAWHPLPPKLWHVGTATEAIVEGGFKTREQLGQVDGGVGLGGGPNDLISFTDDLSIAENIYSALLEGRAVAAGELKFADLVQMDLDDRWGLGAGRITRQWATGQLGIEWPPEQDDMPELLKMKVDEIDGGSIDDRGRRYNEWAWSRDTLGGPSNPVFFSTDWEGLAKLDPADFSIIEIEPEPDRWGHTVGALGEWRLHPAALPPTVAAVHRPAVSDEVLLPRRTLYRGLANTSWSVDDLADLGDDPAEWILSHGLLEGSLGIHWTDSLPSALPFAMGGFGVGDDFIFDDGRADEDRKFRVGVVIQAEVPVSGVVEPGTAEWSLVSDDAQPRDHWEREVTVSPDTDLRVSGVMLAVTDLETGEHTEQWVPLEAIQETIAANPDQRAHAVGVFGGDLRGLFGQPREQASDLLGSLHPNEVDAMSFAAGFDLAEERLWTPEDVRNARFALDTLRNPDVARMALSNLGFGDSPPLDTGGDMTTPVAFLLMHRDRIEVSNGRVAIRLADGTELVNEELSRRINFPEQTTPPPDGTWGLALAAQMVPDLVTSESNYGISTPDDKLRVMALLMQRHAPRAPQTRQAMVQAFNYDANSIFPPGSALTNPEVAHRRFGAITSDPEIQARMTNAYIDLVDQFSTPYSSVGFVDILPIDGNDWDAPTQYGIAAYVTPAGTSYWSPQMFTPEGLKLMRDADFVAVPTVEGVVSHEFAHRLFSGLVNDPEKMGYASAALTMANAAASRALPEGVSVIEAARTLSPYAQTNPIEAYAELFAVWNAGEDVPGWVQLWGNSFRDGMRRATEYQGQLPISREIHDLHGTAGGPLNILTARDFDPDAPTIPDALLSQVQTEVDEYGEVQSTYLQQQLADGLDRVVGAYAPEWISRSSPWVMPVDHEPDEVQLQLGTPEIRQPDGTWEVLDVEEALPLFSLGTGTLEILDRRVGRPELELATQMSIARGQAHTLAVVIPDDLVVSGYVPPLVGREIASYVLNMAQRMGPDDPRRPGLEAARNGIPGDMTMEQFLGEHPEIVDIIKSRDLFGEQGVTGLIIGDDYREVRADHVRETLMSQFEPRPEDLSSLRQAKLAKNYGEDFRARVQHEIDHLGHTPLIQLPELADAEGLSIEEAFAEIEPDVMYHFADWSHHINQRVWTDESGDIIEGFDPDDPDNAEAIEQGAVTEVERDVQVAASLDSVEVDEEKVRLEFVFYSDEGDQVGTSTRDLYWDGHVYHALLELDEAYHGQGIAYSWNRHNDAWYLANGLDTVTVSAGLSKGGYEWASDFFTMDEVQRQKFQDAIEGRARRLLTDPNATPAQIASAAQALLDIESAEERNYRLSAWEVAHLGYHPKVAKSREWVARSMMNGSNWSGTKKLADLMRDADPDVEIPQIPHAGGASSLRDNWHPYWRDFEGFDQDAYSLPEWLHERMPYAGADTYAEDDYIVADAVAQRGREDRYFIPGGEQGHPVLFVPPTYDDATLDTLVSNIAGAFQRNQLDNYTIVFPPDTDPGEIEDRVNAWITTTEERSGSNAPRNIFKAPFIVEGNIVSSTRENRRARLFDTAIYGASVDERFDAQHLGNPVYGFLPTALDVDYYEGAEARERYPLAASSNGGLASVVLYGPRDPETEEIEPWFATWSDQAGVMHLDFTPGTGASAPDGQLNLGLHPLTPEQQATVIRAASRPNGRGKGFTVTTSPDVAALLQEPPRMGTVIEHDGDDLVDVVVPWAYDANSRARLGILNAHGDVERVNISELSGDAMWEVSVRVADDKTNYIRGRLITAMAMQDPIVDVDVATEAARRLLGAAAGGDWGEKFGWTHMDFDLGDRPMASEVASQLVNIYDNDPSLLPGIKLELGRNITWDDDGHLRIDLQGLRDRPKWAAVDMRVFQGDDLAGPNSRASERIRQAFMRWHMASHPNDAYSLVQNLEAGPDATSPRLHLGNTGGADPEDVQTTVDRSMEFLRAFNALRKEGETPFESLRITVNPRGVTDEPDPAMMEAWYKELWGRGYETYTVEGDNPGVIRVKV